MGGKQLYARTPSLRAEKESNMRYVIILLIFWGTIKSISYGLYELKQNKNKLAGIITIILSLARLNFYLYNGIYGNLNHIHYT